MHFRAAKRVAKLFRRRAHAFSSCKKRCKTFPTPRACIFELQNALQNFSDAARMHFRAAKRVAKLFRRRAHAFSSCKKRCKTFPTPRACIFELQKALQNFSDAARMHFRAAKSVAKLFRRRAHAFSSCKKRCKTFPTPRAFIFELQK